MESDKAYLTYIYVYNVSTFPRQEVLAILLFGVPFSSGIGNYFCPLAGWERVQMTARRSVSQRKAAAENNVQSL
jgi:hypothetical protein